MYTTKVIEFPVEVSPAQLSLALKKAAEEHGGTLAEENFSGTKVFVLGSVHEEIRGASVRFSVSIPFSGYTTKWFKAETLECTFGSGRAYYDEALSTFNKDQKYQAMVMDAQVKGPDEVATLGIFCIPVVGWFLGLRRLLLWEIGMKPGAWTHFYGSRRVYCLSAQDRAKIVPFIHAFLDKVGAELHPKPATA